MRLKKMSEVKERVVDLGFEDTELREEPELEVEHEEKERILFPKINPFYIPWFWPMLY